MLQRISGAGVLHAVHLPHRLPHDREIARDRNALHGEHVAVRGRARVHGALTRPRRIHLARRRPEDDENYNDNELNTRSEERHPAP